jgi:hypothetical protein
MSGEESRARQAVAYLNMILALDSDRLWPEDERILRNAIAVAQRIADRPRPPR